MSEFWFCGVCGLLVGYPQTRENGKPFILKNGVVQKCKNPLKELRNQ